MPLSASRSLSLEVKSRLYSACVRSMTLYGSETCPVKEDVIRSDATIVRWMCNVRPEKRISAEECRNRLKLKSMSECEYDDSDNDEYKTDSKIIPW